MVSIVAAVIAVLIFGGVIPLGKSTSQSTISGNILIWGPWPTQVINPLIQGYNNQGNLKVTYVQHASDTFDYDLVEAIASGQGPDLVIIPQDSLYRDQDKLYHIPFASMSEYSFRTTYAQEASLLIYPDGIVGIPMTIDPMIMYYNRNLFDQAGVTKAPATWDELTTITPTLTQKDSRGTLTTSAVPFGTYQNITYAKDILSMLLLQAGNPLVVTTPAMRATLIDTFNLPVAPALSVLQFFLQFSDPLKSTYTWNSAFPTSQQAFLAEQTAMYLGYGSELPSISTKNPNLNFDIARVPQVANSKTAVTYGRMETLAVIKNTKNQAAAFKVLTDFTTSTFISNILTVLAQQGPVAPARLDMLGTKPTDAWGPLIYNSAILSRSWLDPNPIVTDQIFQDMITQANQGSSVLISLISQANNRLGLLLK